jgi:Arabinose efflux permease
MTAASAAIRSDVRVIGLVGFAHGTSHFFHLLLPPLFPWLMPEFGLSFTQAGAMMTVFFVVSALGQAASGFVVDRIGPRRVLLAGIACFVLAALVLAAANGYAMLLAVGALAGLGNSVFHPADFTVLNRKVSPARLGHAFSVHGPVGQHRLGDRPGLPHRHRRGGGLARGGARRGGARRPGLGGGVAAARRHRNSPETAQKSVTAARRAPSASSAPAPCG